MNLLKTREPKPGYEDVFRENESIHSIRMKEVIENDVKDLPEEVFWKTVERLKSKPGNNYDFLIKGEKGLQLALLNLFKIVWREEKLPKDGQIQQ